jgi:TonB family protein
MFETSVIHAQAAVAPRRLGLLTISLIAHSAAILGAVAFSVASVDFPAAAPDEIANAPVFMPITVPPPLGRPDGGAPPAAQPKPAVTPPALRPNEVTAPPEIPDDVPSLDAPGSGDAASTEPGTGTSTEPLGVPWGTDGGVGDLDAPPAIVDVPAVENKVYRIEGEVKAPVLIQRVEPGYPEIMRRSRQTATVIVECVIDKNGRVREPRIVSNTMPPFNDAVIKALSQWRYRPGSLRGEAVEVFLNVTVRFGMN